MKNLKVKRPDAEQDLSIVTGEEEGGGFKRRAASEQTTHLQCSLLAPNASPQGALNQEAVEL